MGHTFETYINRGTRGLNRIGYPAISIQAKSKRLTFNWPAAQAIGVDKHTDGIVLLFSRHEGIVAIRAAGNQESPLAILKVNWTDTGIGSVTVNGFVEAYGIDLDAIAGAHRLGYDPKTELHMFRLPPGAWHKPRGEGEGTANGPASNGKPVPRTIQERRRGARR